MKAKVIVAKANIRTNNGLIFTNECLKNAALKNPEKFEYNHELGELSMTVECKYKLDKEPITVNIVDE